jgi:hypothetical protein
MVWKIVCVCVMRRKERDECKSDGVLGCVSHQGCLLLCEWIGHPRGLHVDCHVGTFHKIFYCHVTWVGGWVSGVFQARSQGCMKKTH